MDLKYYLIGAEFLINKNKKVSEVKKKSTYSNKKYAFVTDLLFRKLFCQNLDLIIKQ